MTEAKHTEGPWVQFVDMGKCVAIMPAGRSGDICTFAQAPSDADAALMTAAPEMLAALKSAVVLSDKRLNPEIGRTRECQRVYDQCIAALDRANGGTKP